MRTQFVVSVQDLRFAMILCRHCNTKVTLDLSFESRPETGRAFDFAPRQCPRCSIRFDSAIPAAVNELQKVWKALSPLEDAVSFTSERDASESGDRVTKP